MRGCARDGRSHDFYPSNSPYKPKFGASVIPLFPPTVKRTKHNLIQRREDNFTSPHPLTKTIIAINQEKLRFPLVQKSNDFSLPMENIAERLDTFFW